MPLVVLGRSDTLAWGFTNTGPDVQDVFIEKINPDDPKQYLTPDGWRPFATEPMAITVKGAGVRNVRAPPHAPRARAARLLPQPRGAAGPGHVAALQWTALTDDDTTIAAGVFDPGIRGVRDYMERMRQYVVPMQSMVLADADGQNRPDRAGPRAGARPRQQGGGPRARAGLGCDLRLEGLPEVRGPAARRSNPPAGAIGTANARIVGPDYPHHLTYDWDAEYRQQRIKELILDRGGHDIASMRAAQADVLSPAASRGCSR